VILLSQEFKLYFYLSNQQELKLLWTRCSRWRCLIIGRAGRTDCSPVSSPFAEFALRRFRCSKCPQLEDERLEAEKIGPSLDRVYNDP